MQGDTIIEDHQEHEEQAPTRKGWFVVFAVAVLFIVVGVVLHDTSPDSPTRSRNMLSTSAHRVLHRNAVGTPTIMEGSLGKVQIQGFRSDSSFTSAAQQTLQGITVDHLGATGIEKMILAAKKAQKDKQGISHFRFQEEIHGMKVEGAAMVMHVDEDGNVFALNGEFVSEDSIPKEATIGCDAAMVIALEQSGIQDGEWLTDCELTIVYGADSRSHLAWKSMILYLPKEGPAQKDVLFASATSGELVARHPEVCGALSVETRDCNQSEYNCNTVSTSSSKINTGDAAIDAAHNHAIDVYNFFYEKFGRDSIDDNGVTLISNVHFGYMVNNAFWDGSEMFYGDGDGYLLSPMSQSLDVVAHEISHGVTSHESNLIYMDQSGALNEAWSDIMGAAVERWKGDSITDTWLLGEDIYTPSTPGDAFRDMADPAVYGDYDYYPTRYTGSDDNGGVHWNSGIANLAFALLVQGGQHPRGKTSVEVPAIDSDFDTSMETATEIFYYANTDCLTPGSNFAAARYCTAEVYGGDYKDNVHAAWDAVGVPKPNEPIYLTDGVSLTNQQAPTDDLQPYILENIAAGEAVTCSLVGSSGDADLYVRFGGRPFVDPGASVNDCKSHGFTSNEQCTTGPAASETSLYVMVYAWSAYRGLQVTCTSGTSDSHGDDPIMLTDGIPMPNQEAKTSNVQQYILKNVSAGTRVSCSVTGYDGITDLYVRFGEEAVADPNSSLNDCKSTSLRSHGVCTTGPAASDTDLFVAVHALSTYRDLEVICFSSPLSNDTIILTDGAATSNQVALTGNVQQYVLENVTAGSTVTCLLDGPNGDADLYVRFGEEADPDSSLNDCMSTSVTSYEECTIGPAASDMDIFAAVYAYSTYSSLQITCTSSGTSPPSNDAIVLTNGVPVSDQEALTGNIQQYVLENISAGAEVTCSLVGSNGDADLYVRFGEEADPDSSLNDCTSTSPTSHEECTIGPVESDMDLFAAVHAYSTYSDLQITCTSSWIGPPSTGPIILMDGFPLSNQGALSGNIQQYVLENISAGAEVTCSLVGSNGDADLYVRFGEEADPDSSLNDCTSTSASSYEQCTIGPAASDTDIFAAVHAYSTYSDLQITCTSSGPDPTDDAIVLTNGVSMSDQEALTGQVEQYILENVTAGATVTCFLVGANGDADLYVRFGEEAVADPNSLQNDCSSTGLTSNEECTTSAAASDTKLFAAIHANSTYNDLQITCILSGTSPPSNDPIVLTDGVPVSNQGASTGNIQQYVLENVTAGATVTCSLISYNGNADLFVRFGEEAVADPNSSLNDCTSTSSTSYKECTAGPAVSDTKLFAAVHAYSTYSALQITCTSRGSGPGSDAIVLMSGVPSGLITILALLLC